MNPFKSSRYLILACLLYLCLPAGAALPVSSTASGMRCDRDPVMFLNCNEHEEENAEHMQRERAQAEEREAHMRREREVEHEQRVRRERAQAEEREAHMRRERAQAEEREAHMRRERAQAEEREDDMRREREMGMERERAELRERRPYRGERDEMDQISPERIEHFLREHGLQPVLQQLDQARREGHREDVEDQLEQIQDLMMEYREVREERPEIAERMIEGVRLEVHSAHLAEELRRENGPPGPREEMKRELHEILEHLFELRMEDNIRQLHELEQELEHLRHQVARRREARGRIIERRMRELLEEDEFLDW